MSSGFGFKGREGRCYQFWKGVEQCSKDTEYSGQCGKQVEDYIECLHHKKGVDTHECGDHPKGKRRSCCSSS
ncbi:unnamed protein product [Peronospora belbahrii]|uniref:NADH dehydrogenase [ubiquinone] iron-sulfur protein 5 n=1 Tax=Peronospora belbahrii TaxID=622444 RepID=A0AAU9KJQ7_9STRA|nr:unnamed protein product [Peronospora belbahrii]